MTTTNNDSKSSYLNVRVTSDLKKRFDVFCKGIGSTGSKTVMLFARYCIYSDKAFSFNFSNYDIAQDNSEPIIVGFRLTNGLREKFAKFCDKFELPMAVFIRDFMISCITKNKLPFDINEIAKMKSSLTISKEKKENV
ncbi:MAG: hypothetical protein FWC47_07025 [Oscillospiraceae bacterium]|nr:hypothetical protein [Oscillospiraceae bacterium]